jgi:hypothetical protein
MDIFLSNAQAIAQKWRPFLIAYLSFSHHPCGHILQCVEVDPSILLCQVVVLAKIFLFKCMGEYMGLCQMDSKLSTDLFEKVLTLAMEGSKAVAEYMRQVPSSLLPTHLPSQLASY